MRGRPQPVQTDAAHHRRQPRPQIDDAVASCAERVPPQPGVLDRVLGIGERAGEPVGHGQEVRTEPLEFVGPQRGGHSLSLTRRRPTRRSIAGYPNPLIPVSDREN